MPKITPIRTDRLAHTYSIVARDPSTGQLGVAVQSHAFSVGSIVPWAEAGVGAVATQAFANSDYGPEGLALLREGQNAEQALAKLLKADEGREIRQVAIVDAQGRFATHTGNNCFPAAGHLVGENCAVQANLMVDDSIWPAMKKAYEESRGEFANRLIAALEAAQEAGGDVRGQQSAALLIVSGERQQKFWHGRLFDLRVEDHPRPIEELKRLTSIRQAWLLFEKGSELALAGHADEALSFVKQALELQPDITELRLRCTEIFFRAGRPQEAMSIIYDILAKEPVWAEMMRRLAAVGMLPDSPQLRQMLQNQR